MATAALILAAMDLAVAALKAYPGARQAYDEWRRDLEAMQREGRDPTQAEMDRFTRRIARSRRALHGDGPPDGSPDGPADPPPP
jgi:hypothetical protein